MIQIPSFNVENNVPIPPGGFGDSTSRWPVGLMKVGESFLIPSTIENYHVLDRNVRVVTSTTGRRHKKEFTVRRVPEGTRVWRIK